MSPISLGIAKDTKNWQCTMHCFLEFHECTSSFPTLVCLVSLETSDLCKLLQMILVYLAMYLIVSTLKSVFSHKSPLWCGTWAISY